jgi:hypothetical protein
VVFAAPVDPAEARRLAEVQTFAARAEETSSGVGKPLLTTISVTRRRSLPPRVRAEIR